MEANVPLVGTGVEPNITSRQLPSPHLDSHMLTNICCYVSRRSANAYRIADTLSHKRPRLISFPSILVLTMDLYWICTKD